MPATLGGEAAKMAVLCDWASQTIRPWQWQWGLSRSVTSPSLCLSLPFFSFPLPSFLCLIFSMFQNHTHTQRQNIFISRLYAGCAQPEIAGLTPRCELYRGNVYSNPTEHAINLFLDRRQTRMSLHEGNKDRHSKDHHGNHLIMNLREAVRSQEASSPGDTYSAVYQCV